MRLFLSFFMKISFNHWKMIPALAIMFFMVPAAQAGPIGDAFDATVKQSSFSYDAHASITLDKGGESDAPFAGELSVREEGGKSQGVYGKSGAIWVEAREIDDMPRELSGLTKMNMSMDYNGAHIESTKTSYAELENMAFSSDHEKMNEVMGMMNQFGKFFTGKSFKVSQVALAEKFRSLMGDSFYGPSEEELFLAALSGGNKSIAELIGSVGDFVDTMIESGFLKMEVTQSSGRRGRTGVSGGTTYILSLGDTVSASGGALFRDGLAKFLSSMMPGFGDVLSEEIARESAEVIANDLTGFLNEAGKVDFSLTIVVSNGLVSSSDFIMDLSPMNVPFMVKETVDFNYSAGYQASIPTDDNLIIDINQIVDGFMTLAEMGSSSYGYDDYAFEEVSMIPTEAVELSFGSYVYNDVQYILSVCGSDKDCKRREMRYVMESLRNLKSEGFLTGQEFSQAVRDLRLGLR